MQSKVNYALVGLFVMFLGGALLGAVFWLTLGAEDKVYDSYRVYFQESVAGLNPKATVRFRGVQVGQVASIRLDPHNPNQVDVVLQIERGTPIYHDTIATLSTRGLTGVAAVELSGGGKDATLERAAGQDLPVIKAGPSLVSRLDDALNNIVDNVNTLSSKLERLLGDANQTALTAILQNLSAISATVANRADSIDQTLLHVENMSAALAVHAARFGSALDKVSAELEQTSGVSAQLKATLGAVRSSAQAITKLAGTASETSRAFTRLAGDGRQELQRVGQNTLPELEALLLQANHLLGTLQRLAGMLEENPRALLIGKPQGKPGPGER